MASVINNCMYRCLATLMSWVSGHFCIGEIKTKNKQNKNNSPPTLGFQYPLSWRRNCVTRKHITSNTWIYIYIWEKPKQCLSFLPSIQPKRWNSALNVASGRKSINSWPRSRKYQGRWFLGTRCKYWHGSYWRIPCARRRRPYLYHRRRSYWFCGGKCQSCNHQDQDD